MGHSFVLENLQIILKETGTGRAPIAAIGGFDDALEFAQLIKEVGFKLVAVSDKGSGIVDIGGNGGLNVSKLISNKKEGKSFGEMDLEKVRRTKPEFLMRMEVDVLVPINGRGVINKDNAGDVRAKVIVQRCRGLITREASKILEEKMIPVIQVYS